MASNLNVFDTLAEYEQKKSLGVLGVPNVSYIKSPESVQYIKDTAAQIGIASFESGKRRYYTLDAWNALSVKPTVLGVYVKTLNCGFIIHPTAQNNSVGWSHNTTYLIPGVTTTTSSAVALQDFNGKANTEAVLAAVAAGDIENAPAFTWIKEQVWADTSADAYLGATGEAETMRLNMEAINACLTAVGGTLLEFAGKYVWSSTQYSANRAWGWGSSGWGNDRKYPSRVARALCLI